MKAWAGLLALGIVVLAAGGAMVVLRLHRTIGLGVVGLGAVLLVVGLVFLARGPRGASSAQAKPPVSRVQKRGLRNSLIAIAVVVVIGVGTFYGTTYLASGQSGNNTSSPSSTSSRGSPSNTSTRGTTSGSSCTPSPIHICTTSTTNSGSTTASTNSTTEVITTSRPTQSSTHSTTSGSTTATLSCLSSTKSIDGSAINYNASGTSGSVELTTKDSLDVVIVFATVLNYPNLTATIPPRVTGIADGTGSLFFYLRASFVTVIPNHANDKFSEEEWYAIASAPLSNDSITVELASTTDVLTIVAFGVSGANATNPFDGNSGVPVAVSGTTKGTISAAVSTTCSDDMIIGGAAMYSLNPTPGAGYALIQTDNGASLAQDPIAEYQVVTSPQIDLNVTFAGQTTAFTQTWIIIADALN